MLELLKVIVLNAEVELINLQLYIHMVVFYIFVDGIYSVFVINRQFCL